MDAWSQHCALPLRFIEPGKRAAPFSTSTFHLGELLFAVGARLHIGRPVLIRSGQQLKTLPV